MQRISWQPCLPVIPVPDNKCSDPDREYACLVEVDTTGAGEGARRWTGL